MNRLVSIATILVCAPLLGNTYGATSATPEGDEAAVEVDQALLARYTAMLEALRSELAEKVPRVDQAGRQALTEAGKAVVPLAGRIWHAKRIKDETQREQKLNEITAAQAQAEDQFRNLGEKLGVVPFLRNDTLDAKLVKYVVLHQATPRALAEYASKGEKSAALIEQLLSDADLMKQMVVADGPIALRFRRHHGPAPYGPAMQIYADIQKASSRSRSGVLQRLALAIALEHAVPVKQQNPAAATDAPATVDPLKRYAHYGKACLAEELDPEFKGLRTWDLRHVVYGHEPDATLAWGRKTLRNFRPDHVHQPNHGWRYVGVVASDVKYGSGDNKYDKPELQFFQNILMNGGVCGRRAFFGRFMLRAWGIPTIARPSRGHAALARWTPRGWVVCLGPKWGGGSHGNYAGRYPRDIDFLAATQARENEKAFMQVKRAYWAADVEGEARSYGEFTGKPVPFWSNVAIKTQRLIIQNSEIETLAAIGEHLGEADGKEKATSAPVSLAGKGIQAGADDCIIIPAAAYVKPEGSTREVKAMKSFAGDHQIFLPRFDLEGTTLMRGGTWKNPADAVFSGKRLLAGGRGVYDNWGFRAAMTQPGGDAPRELKVELADGVTMEFVYIKPGTFTMGGENTSEGRFLCVEVPKHEATISRGFYLGKYEITQAQYAAIMGYNPSRSTKAPDCPVDSITWSDALKFCELAAEKTGRGVRLPTEAEWEYACRAGSKTRWFFGDDPSSLGDYAWLKDNAGGKSHPVGKKKPNPWGLYDIYGNVCERVADIYASDYYAKSPKQDPTGPAQSAKSHFAYDITVPKAGHYELTASVVTVKHGQFLNVSVAGTGSDAVLEMPFTVGDWQESRPVTLTLSEGKNTLRLWREHAPQKGLAIKTFRLKPVR